jgi:hypothetical protein|tara:strand:- start:7259 stop:7696 length:438 start_codon:yes stop_codon:yes gene_type:complete
MTKKDLVKIIREVVRREVQKEVQKIFIKEETSPTLESMVSKISIPEEKPIVKKHFTKDKTLNSILNETTALSKRSEYETMGGGTFDTSRMSELIGYGKPEEVQRDMVAADSFKKAGVQADQVPEHVTNALTRDYSSLMKVLNKDK